MSKHNFMVEPEKSRRGAGNRTQAEKLEGKTSTTEPQDCDGNLLSESLIELTGLILFLD